jgi:hypothetical protein
MEDATYDQADERAKILRRGLPRPPVQAAVWRSRLVPEVQEGQ